MREGRQAFMCILEVIPSPPLVGSGPVTDHVIGWVRGLRYRAD
jgi:hypothetical protein